MPFFIENQKDPFDVTGLAKIGKIDDNRLQVIKPQTTLNTHALDSRFTT